MITKYKNVSDYLNSHIDDIKDVKKMEDLLTLLISDYTHAESTIIDEHSSDMKRSEELLLKEVNKIIDKSNELLKDVER